MKLLGFCLLPNYFHLVLEPADQTALSQFMQWLLTSRVRRYHKHYGSSGHVWQGRFKSFPVERDEHLMTVGVALCSTKSDSRRLIGYSARMAVVECAKKAACGPLTRGGREVATIRECLNRQRPFGQSEWQAEMASKFGLNSTLRRRGRPAE